MMGPIIALVVLYFFFTVVTVAVYASRVQKAGPNEALIISGRQTRDPKTGQVETIRVVTGGRAFIWPILEQVQLISLALTPLEVRVEDAATQDDQTVSLHIAARFKIMGDRESILTAAERFLGQTHSALEGVVQAAIEDQVFEHMRQHTLDYIRREYRKLAYQIHDHINDELAAMGLMVEIFNLKLTR